MAQPISRSSSIPLHVQIRRAIQEQIASGELAPGDRLPNEHDYARALGVSIAPVRQAMLDLVSSGHLIRRKGLGTFVRDAQFEEEIDLLGSFTEKFRRRGAPMRFQVLDQRRIRASEAVAKALELRPRAAVVRLRRLAWFGDGPAAILDAFLPVPPFGPLTEVSGFDQGRSLYATLDERFGVRLGQARSRLEVGRLTEEESRLLEQPEGSPVLRVWSVTRDTDGRPVEVSWVSYRADRFAFTITSQPSGPAE